MVWQLLADRPSQGTPRESLLYFSFEDERLAGIQGKDLELDFLARHIDGHADLIQVCAGIDQPDILARELRALQDVTEEFPQAALVLIVLDRPPVVEVPDGIRVIEARDWLLENPRSLQGIWKLQNHQGYNNRWRGMDR